MSKVMGTMMTIWGFIMGTITYFNYINSPAHIQFNGGFKYSLIDSGIMMPALFSLMLLTFGIVFLAVSKEPRDV
ncbi:MAG: hypothetical protein KA797_00045 [Chitinophagales bacterium]|nr:hypothetical protein [Chitinophagales bacterium]